MRTNNQEDQITSVDLLRKKLVKTAEDLAKLEQKYRTDTEELGR